MDFSTGLYIKIVVDRITPEQGIYYWNGSAWALIGILDTHVLSASDLKVYFSVNINTNDPTIMNMDDLYVTNYDYATLTP